MPVLPVQLAANQRDTCLALVYLALKLTLEAKKTLSEEQREALKAAVADAIEVQCTALPLAVSIWLRNKTELGNRLISTSLLAVCAYTEATRPFARRAAKLVLKLPTDLTEFLNEYDKWAGLSGSNPKRPTCVKKIARDIMECLPAYQAGKYSATTKIQRTKALLKKTMPQEEVPASGAPPAGGFMGGIFGLFGSHHSKKTKQESKQRQDEKRVTQLQEQLQKLQGGDLKRLLRYTHASSNHELFMAILRKRYPESQEEFEMSGLAGEYDPERAGKRMKVETPPTWDRELSEKGNVPTTWAPLVRAKDERGRYTLPYMAMLRNLRNILLMGFSREFLQTHILSRLPQRNQIQGSGQTAISLSHTWSTLQKEFSEEKLKDMHEQAVKGWRDVIAFNLLLRKICGPILGMNDKQVGIIGEFLGEPVWEPCGLRRQGDCFLAQNHITVRDGQVLDGSAGKGGAAKGKGKGKGKGGKGGVKTEKWLPVPCNPVTPELLEDFRVAFDKAIQVAASCATEPIDFGGEGPAAVWMDLSNPPLETATEKEAREAESQAAEAKIKKAQDAVPSGGTIVGLEHLKDEVIVTRPGQECELDEITTWRDLNLELRYFCSSYIDYNVMAYDGTGSHLWNSTFSNTEIKGKDGNPCVVHCRDICSNPSPTEPALRTLHLDLDNIPDEVLAMMITSQTYTYSRPEGVSIALRECHNGGARSLRGNHQPHDCNGKVLLAADIGEPMKKGGTTVYACIYRDVNEPSSWLFRNTLDLSLASESHIAAQISDASGFIFRQMFQDKALLSTLDANRLGYVRVCQLYQALTAPLRGKRDEGKSEPRKARVLLTGVPRRKSAPEVVEVELTGQYVADLEAVQKAKKYFSAKAVDADTSLHLVLKALKCDSGAAAPCGLIRVANNSLVPEEELKGARKRSGKAFPYATVDVRGHIFDSFRDLPELEQAVYVPGQVESCVTILRNVLAQLQEASGEGSSAAAGAELLVRYVDSFLPREEAPDEDMADPKAE